MVTVKTPEARSLGGPGSGGSVGQFRELVDQHDPQLGFGGPDDPPSGGGGGGGDGGGGGGFGGRLLVLAVLLALVIGGAAALLPPVVWSLLLALAVVHMEVRRELPHDEAGPDS